MIGAAVLLVVAAASADAQYSRPVFAYVNECIENASATLPNGSRTTVGGYATNALPVSGSGRIAVTGPGRFTDGAGQISINLRSSALLYISDADATCRYSLQGISTSGIISWAQEKAELHEGFRRRDARLRNILWVGAVAVFAGTLATSFTEVDGVVEGDAVLLLSGTALSITMGWLGGTLASDASDERAKRDRFRALETRVKAVAQ